MSTACPACAVLGKKEVRVGAGLVVKVNPAIEAVPPGVATDTLPLAPAPTMAVISVGVFTTNDAAGVPPKRTAVAPVKLVPLICTKRPCCAEAGENEVRVGAGGVVNTKPAREAVPPGVVTDRLPLLPAPTVARILVGLTTLKEAAGVPPKRSAVAPVKFVPLMLTCWPVVADVGEKLPMVGTPVTKNAKPAREAVPVEVVTSTWPEAPVPTTAAMVVAPRTTNEAAGVPPKRTAVAPVKLLPVISTARPCRADVGENPWMTGTPVER